MSKDTLDEPQEPQAKFTPPRQSIWALNTRRIVMAGVLVGITIILGLPGLNVGFIPVPNSTGHATIEHLPTIIAGVLEGPVIGMITGFFFGLMSFLNAGVPLFKDPLIAFVPRILIGLTSWLAFAGLKRFNIDVAAAAAGIIGALTNSVFVIGFGIVRGLFPAALIPLVIPQALIEMVVAAILTVLIARAFYIVQGRVVRAPDKKSRDQLPY
ncbi:MAG: ECF transporter S component [Chloroflexota bacterium]|nr:ECF transporter S component [Chloroflexota bacterium]